MIKKSIKKFVHKETNNKYKNINRLLIGIILLGIFLIAIVIFINKPVVIENISIIDDKLPIASDQQQSTLYTLYDFYQELDRPASNDYILYVMDPNDDYVLDMYFSDFSFDDAVFYVQDLPYVAEENDSEYPKYPIETMVDGGDCEDKSILLVSILDVIGIDAELLRYSNHMAVMVDGCYVETTVNGCDCKTPVGYKGLDPVVYNLKNRSIISIKWKADFYRSNNELWVDANIIVGNYGNMISDNIILKINNTNYEIDIGVVDVFSIKKINFVKPVNDFDFEVLL